MQRRFYLSVLALSIFAPTHAGATAFVSLTDPDLAAAAPVIVRVTVIAADAAPAGPRPATDFTVQVERVVQGTVPGSSLLVRVPGGAAPAGTGAARLVVQGAPVLRAGERAVLFLTPAADGSYRVVDLALGVFHEVEAGGRLLAVRDLSDLAELAPGSTLGLIPPPGSTVGAGTAAEAPRDLDGFLSWLAARAAGEPAAGDYQVALGAAEREALARDMASVHQTVLGVADLAGAAGDAAVAGAPLANLAWTLRDEGRSGWPDAATLVLPGLPGATYGGASRSDARLVRFEGETTVLLAGPGAPAGAASLDDLLPAAPGFSCARGGIASVSGTWYDAEGQLLGGGVIVAVGASCLLAIHPVGAAAALLAVEMSQALSGSSASTGAPAAVQKAATPAASQGKAAALPARGYQARACGFDLNRNGVFGEAADCHAICNGGTGGLDTGGVLRNQIYISCNTGADTASCGAPGTPCRTISYTWNNRTSPAGANAADILCFRGICHEENITTAASGRPGVYLKPQSGSEARSFELPLHPTMLVGWDFNHDGVYPPYDTADQAVLDGSGLSEAIWLAANTPNSYVELAHFTVRNYGTGVNSSQNGFLRIGGNNGSASHIYVHDIAIQNVNAGQGLDSGNIVFNLFTANTQVQHLAIENVQVLNAGGYLVRGSGTTGANGTPLFENGPYRFERISWTARSCNDTGLAGACADPGSEAHAIGWKLWGYITGIEVLDSRLQLQPSAWTPHPSGFGSTAFVPAQCSRNWTIRNNEIDDFKIGLTAQGYAQGYCDGAAARPLDGVVFDHNLFLNTYAPWIYGNNGVVISGGGPNPQTSVGRVVVTNDIFVSLPGWQGMAYIDAGNAGGPDPGSFQFTNNTTVAKLTRSGFGAVTVMNGNSYPAQVYSFHGNVVARSGGGENFHLAFAPIAWSADGNVFDPAAAFTWGQTSCAALAPWQHTSQQDGDSRACRPQLVNAAADDFRVAPGDPCGGGAGASVAPPAVLPH
jgi:hypothetical protein